MRPTLIGIFVVLPLAAQCTYTTLAGHAVTFAGENVAVQAVPNGSQTLFLNPETVAAGSDGSIYIADSGNNRIRRIDSSGIIRTIAGTGQASFAGDNGPATAAALNAPAALLLGEDGSLYFSDVGNNRVRVIRPNGTISTVAGNGTWKFGGDNGPAVAASLNQPGALAIDSPGNLLIADSGNARVRRVDATGVITTIAGYETPNDYYIYGPQPVITPTAAVQYNFTGLAGVAVGPDGLIYITDNYAIWTLGSDGILHPWLTFDNAATSTPLTAATNLGSLQVTYAEISVLADNEQILSTPLGLLRVASGQVTQLSNSNIAVSNIAADPSADGIVALSTEKDYAFIGLAGGTTATTTRITRVGADGSSSVIYTSLPNSNVSATPALSLGLAPTGALAVGPDGTIYFGDVTLGPNPPYGRILALRTGGSVNLVTTTTEPPKSLVLDTKGNLYFLAPSSSQIMKVPAAGGVPQLAYTASSPLISLGIDGQDRIYAFEDNVSSPFIRFNADGTQQTLLSSSFNYFGSLQPYSVSAVPYPLAVAKDGTVYSLADVSFTNNASDVLSLSPSGTTGLLPMETRITPTAMTVPAASGTFMASSGEIRNVLADGTIVTIFGSDLMGFHGEYGYDSEPQPTTIDGMALGGDGNLIVADTSGGAIRRINAASCSVTPTPLINGISDSAMGVSFLYHFSAGGLFSIYGKRLGPSTGVVAAFDATGHLPKQLAGTTVTVNGIPAPLLYVSATQINATVPFELDGQGNGTVTVQYNSGASDSFSQAFGYFAPTVFSTPQGNQRYAVALNQDATPNSQQNPAKAGSVVTIYATGTGGTSPAGEDGKQAGLPLKYTVLPISITIDGQAGGTLYSEAAQVLYAGSAPYLVEGTTQINFRIPADAPNSVSYFSLSMGAGLGGFASGTYFIYTAQ